MSLPNDYPAYNKSISELLKEDSFLQEAKTPLRSSDTALRPQLTLTPESPPLSSFPSFKVPAAQDTAAGKETDGRLYREISQSFFHPSVHDDTAASSPFLTDAADPMVDFDLESILSASPALTNMISEAEVDDPSSSFVPTESLFTPLSDINQPQHQQPCVSTPIPATPAFMPAPSPSSDPLWQQLQQQQAACLHQFNLSQGFNNFNDWPPVFAPAPLSYPPHSAIYPATVSPSIFNPLPEQPVHSIPAYLHLPLSHQQQHLQLQSPTPPPQQQYLKPEEEEEEEDITADPTEPIEPSYTIETTTEARRRRRTTNLYRCDHAGCTKTFTRRYNLKAHYETHNPNRVKRYTCTECSKRFSRSHDLSRHTVIHTQNREHSCPRCNKEYTRFDALVRHLASAHQVKLEETD
ncbi:hypothetical protein HK104_005734 [Borealophlyctis nickersoniae]|nr:hypothetical protein HK104_005734 [Borealophlyctis nickersoniae]